jgi:hypothetical protein
MKILVSQVVSAKNKDRLELVANGTIRSRSNSHTIYRNMIAEGERPSFLPPEYSWIPSEDVFINHRHLRGMEKALPMADIDLVIFCDDDVVIDIDTIAEITSSHINTPTIWTTDPGMMGDKRITDSMQKHAPSLMSGKNPSSLFMGFCTSVVNKAFLQKLRENSAALEATWNVSKEVFGSGFVMDCQISILGFLIGAKHITGQQNGGTCWATFCASPLLSKTGKMWHVHGFRESPDISQDGLMKLLSICPVDNETIIPTLWKNLRTGVKAKEWANRPLVFHWMFRPWTGRLMRYNIMIEGMKTKLITADGFFDRGTIKWEHNRPMFWQACDGGLRVYDGTGWAVKFIWQSDENAIFGCLEKPSGFMHDTTIFGLWAE